MNWLLPAALSPAVLSIVNFTDKYLVCGQNLDYRGVTIYSAVTATLMGMLFWIFSGFAILTPVDMGLVIMSGCLSIWATVLYFRAISRDSTSKIIILLQMVPVLVLILSMAFLGEKVTIIRLIGFFVILASAVCLELSTAASVNGWGRSTFILILIADFMWALSSVVFKFVAGHYSFLELLAYESWGFTVGGVLLLVVFPFMRQAFQDSLRMTNKKVLGFVFLNEGIYVVAKLLGFWALALGPASLVSVIGSTQVLFGILFGLVLSRISPEVFAEDFTRSGFANKTTFAFFMLIGVWMVY